MLIDTGSPYTWLPTIDCYHEDIDENGGAWLHNYCYTGGISDLIREL